MLQPESLCLLIADISGYTEYLAGVEIDHAQDILADLIGTVVTSLRPTFRLAKLEGDAAFCFAPADKLDGAKLLDTIEHCYFSFRRRRRDVRQATSCECNACVRIPTLNLKFVAHYGVAIRQKVAGHEELLGSDVIVVHRLLKNDIVEKLDVAAYAGVTAKLTERLEIDPASLQMQPLSEVYEHVGEVPIWVLDLERRWQEEEARQRVYVGPDDAIFTNVTTVEAPPQVVWEFLTTPGRRMQWQFAGGTTAIDEQPAAGNRRGVGTVNHCMHGPAAIIENVLDWRPFDYLTTRSQMPNGGPSFVATFEFEPTPTGTNVFYRVQKPTKAADIKAIEALGPVFQEGFAKGLAVLKEVAPAEVADLNAGRAEPALPTMRNADGFLGGIPPIQMLD